MFRRWFSGFIKKNKEKFYMILKIAVIIGIFMIALYYVFSSLDNDNGKDKNLTIYEPTDTVIDGSNIKQEEYEEDDNIVYTFIEYCNEGNVESAYNLLTDNCKKVLYPTIQDFNEKYYKKYFTEKREYNLQAWVNNGNYKTYRLRITDDILSTGNYDDSEKYQDYITIVDNNGGKKVNINSFIETNEINKITEKDGITIKVNSVAIFVDYQEYTFEIINNTTNTIMLDNLEKPSETIRINTSDGFNYGVRLNSVNSIKLRVAPGQSKTIKIIFDKKYTSGGIAQEINFKKVIINYEEYIMDKQNYSGTIELKIAI